MQSSQTRLICRAHNRFSPSIAPWQYFVARSRPLRLQHRLSSSVTEALPKNEGGHVEGSDLQEPTKVGHPEVRPEKNDQPEGVTGKQPRLRLRKKNTDKGEWHSTPVEASKAKNMRKRYKDTQAAHKKLLAAARAAFYKSEDYKGVVVDPLVSPKPIWENNLPWCVREEKESLSGIERLAIEIPKFHDYARPNKLQSIARKHVIETVREHVRHFLPHHVLELFGSERTGIALATSDIDLRLIPPGYTPATGKSNFPPEPAQRQKLKEDLFRLYNDFLRKNKAYAGSTLRAARYPLISLQHKASGQDVQIVLANDTSVSRNIMQDYMDEYPYLTQLHSVIKTMFDLRGLSDVYQGGFGSYPLFMMIVASLRHMPHPRKDAAGGLIHFLKFYRDFDTTKHGISIEPTVLFDKVAEAPITDTAKAKIRDGTLKPLPNYMLSLRDPADETNDLGRKGIAIKHVQATFRSLLDQLTYDLRANKRHSLLAPLVGPCYRLNEKRRVQLEKYGTIVRDNQAPNSLAEVAKAIRQGDQTSTRIVQETGIEDQTSEKRDTTWDNMTGDKFRQFQVEIEKNP